MYALKWSERLDESAYTAQDLGLITFNDTGLFRRKITGASKIRSEVMVC
jgi:hypothetical protein